MSADQNEIVNKARFPVLGQLKPGVVERHEIVLPGDALKQERWPVITISGVNAGPTMFINAGIHGGEYPAIETVIRLGKLIDPSILSGTVVLMPVVNLPAFRQRSMFVCPVDDLNPNRMFPGDPNGSYTEQLVYALTTEFISHADAYIDLHGGDIVEDLVPFAICQAGSNRVDKKALELARIFGLPYLLTVDHPVQPAKGSMSFVAAAELGVPGFIAEAGGVGQLQQEAVDMLTAGVLRVLDHLEMLETTVVDVPAPTTLGSFEWLYCQQAGMFYCTVAVDELVDEGQIVGSIGSLYGDVVEEITSPVTGRVLFLTSNPAVSSNGLLMGVGVDA